MGEPPPEEAIGGTVIGLDTFLWPRSDSAGEEYRRPVRELPELPSPWTLEASGARVVPLSHWLDPDVQVPMSVLGRAKQGSREGEASLHLKVALYDEEPREEEPPPVSESPLPVAT